MSQRFFSEFGRGNPQFFLKDITKVVTVAKSGLSGDFQYGKTGFHKQLLRMVDFYHGKEIGVGAFQIRGEKS